MTDPIRSLDDLAPGMAWDLGTLTLSQDEVVDFATKYDPQYFHLDAEAAKQSIFGELVASGLHTLSAVFGRVMGSGLLAQVSLGGNQIDTKWPAPCVRTRRSQSAPRCWNCARRAPAVRSASRSSGTPARASATASW